MKKIRLITLALVVAVMLMGAGYAYWTETLSINTTVSTGELNVEFTNCVTPTVGGPVDDDDDVAGVGVDYVDPAASKADSNHTINFTLNKVYPGSGGHLTFEIKNTGTVAAKMSTSAITGVASGNEGLVNHIQYSVRSLRVIRAGGTIEVLPGIGPMNDLTAFLTELNNRLAPIVLAPQDAISVNPVGVEEGYTLMFDSSVGNDETTGAHLYEHNQLYELVLTLNYTQG